MFTAILVFLLFFQIETPVFNAAPGESGAWLSRNENWLKMSPAPVSNAKARGLDNYLYTNGYTSLDMDVSFAGPMAALRISDREPVFLVVPEDDKNYEPMLIRLSKKKDRRTTRTRLSSATIDNKQGFRRQDIVRTIITVNSDKSLAVRPERSLKPGEYLFVAGQSGFGCDFGVD
jgi:hypothetical protein